MKKYKCHKVVKAIEMTRAEYNIYRGWELPENECGDDEGGSMTPGKYLVRIRWFNKMNGRQFDEWQIRTWDGSRWNLFSGCEVVEWRAL